MRWFGWLIKTSLAVVLISGLTMLTTGMVVNAYIKSLLDSFHIQLKNEPASLNVFGGSLFGSKQPDAGTTESAVTGAPSKTGSTPGQQGSTPAKPSSEEAPDGAVPVMGSSSQEQAGTKKDAPASAATAVGGERLVMTPGDIAKKKESLSEADKQQIFTMLMNKLPAEDIQKISAAMEGGLTETELQEIQQIIAKRMTSEEYTKLMKLIEK